ncbi:NUDIX hydrolase [Acinetobacter rudis]|uniref:Phosphatase NudJ n=1 Tax=Acinetobacter rudis TaxID=632955 RepID=A0AAW8J5L3_9GAMM|nr:NUDIX hydrolase [Acinetobacter rudis]MDQ8934454.1 NUDIX hydrolase [Acinetobacter rudis]MDQ8951851.1 NUDIX hydrolase [Acinetobacter rudis]MDQ9016646.1 NUDIX hydrolase [Acinetobacter rudis]
MTQWMPHVTVATVIEQDGKFLMVEEYSTGISHPVFNQPAGHVECAESLIEAAQRETMEETGYQVEIQALLGIYSYTPPMFPDRTYYRFCFLGDVVQHFPDAKLDEGIITAVWMSLEELQNSARARSPLVTKAIQDALSGQRYPLSLIYEHKNSPFNLIQDA